MRFLLPHLLLDAADAGPDDEAVVCRSDRLTYGELLDQSQRLATTLVELGIQRGDRVGIHMGKSVESIVALWGVMSAAGAYVPLDSNAPPQRLEFMIRDCEIDLLITDSTFVRSSDPLSANEVNLKALIGPDSDPNYKTVPWDEVASSDPHPVPGPSSQSDLSYILYTSGSTGTPKGIMHTHASALAWAEMTRAVYSVTRSDILSNYAPLHFDLSTLDLFTSVTGGASMVMIPEEHMVMPASLASLLEAEKLTLFYTVPLALIQLAQPGVLEGRDLSHLQRILFGGEPMPIKHLRALSAALPNTDFYNVYGPTETNGCVHHLVRSDDLADDEPLPIGLPYPNVETQIVDSAEMPVDQGSIGEIIVHAPTLMRGYWNRDDLNESAFSYKSRFSGLPDVYHRTGDLVHRDAEGIIHFHGRKDRQVKVRGYRVELDEIEAVLLSHDSVKEAAVFARKLDETTTIHAALLPVDDLNTTVETVISHASQALPPYAVPSQIEFRDDFPRTSSGKIDRIRLSEIVESESAQT